MDLAFAAAGRAVGAPRSLRDAVIRLLADASPPSDSLSLAALGIGLAGGLALFLYGVEKISVGLREAAGDRLRMLLARLTTNRFTAVATGIVVTAALQSSSLSTVLVVGFVSTGLMTLQQSVGVIMGANIGTTLAVQIAAFHASRTAWLFVAGGVWPPPRDAGTLFVNWERCCWVWGCCFWRWSRCRPPPARCGTTLTFCESWRGWSSLCGGCWPAR